MLVRQRGMGGQRPNDQIGLNVIVLRDKISFSCASSLLFTSDVKNLRKLNLPNSS